MMTLRTDRVLLAGAIVWASAWSARSAPGGIPPTQHPGPQARVAPAPGPAASQPEFVKPTPEEALRFLKSLPRVWRNTRDYDPNAPARKILVQLWEKFTVEDLKTTKVIHPGGHVDDPGAPNRFSQHHLHLKPGDWRYFTAFEALEAFEATHDLEGITDESLFFFGRLPQSMRRIQLEMCEATGAGVRHLASLKNLKSLSLNFSMNIEDAALTHVAEIASLEHLDVNGCPKITGKTVGELARLRQLKVLRIGGTSLSDASLKHFRDLTIEELDLSDNVAEWVVRYRGGGEHRFTVTFAGLKALLADRSSLPNLRRLVVGKSPRSLRAGEILTKEQKAELARLRPGLEVR